MSRSFLGALLVSATLAGVALAFEVPATLKRVDADKGLLVFNAQQKDRTVRVAKDAKFLDAAGKELKDGLRSPELKEGAQVTLTIEKDGDNPLITAIQLTPKSQPAAVAKDPKPQENPRFDTSKLLPLCDMGKDHKYQGFAGRLYPSGTNTRPANHEQAGLALAKTVVPLDKEGQLHQDGKIVLLGIGFSNTFQAFKRLQAKGVTRQQVQVVWLKETNPAPHGAPFPASAKTLEEQTAKIVQLLAKRFANCKMVYLSSRSWAGWARVPPDKNPKRQEPGNSEPYSYETGFAVKWLIAKQLDGDPALKYTALDRKAPWLSWGPYLWANGDKPRQDGFRYQLSDFRDDDRMHHSLAGMKNLGNVLLRFFKTDTTTRGWFRS
jgi:hypothetical protein